MGFLYGQPQSKLGDCNGTMQLAMYLCVASAGPGTTAVWWSTCGPVPHTGHAEIHGSDHMLDISGMILKCPTQSSSTAGHFVQQWSVWSVKCPAEGFLFAGFQVAKCPAGIQNVRQSTECLPDIFSSTPEIILAITNTRPTALFRYIICVQMRPKWPQSIQKMHAWLAQSVQYNPNSFLC